MILSRSEIKFCMLVMSVLMSFSPVSERKKERERRGRGGGEREKQRGRDRNEERERELARVLG